LGGTILALPLAFSLPFGLERAWQAITGDFLIVSVFGSAVILIGLFAALFQILR